LRLSCLPGATRTYCSSDGTLYPCEKTERGKLFEIGDAAGDVDVTKAIALTERVRLLCDCGNCIANRLCSHCPGRLSELIGAPGGADAPAFQAECQQMAQRVLPAQLTEYTEAMEASPQCLDAFLASQKTENDWLNDLGIVAPIWDGPPPTVEAIVEDL
jgi:hypothetical protein